MDLALNKLQWLIRRKTKPNLLNLVAVLQSSEDPSNSFEPRLAPNVIKRNRQLIFVLRECVSSSTVTFLVPEEQKETLQEAILKACLSIRNILAFVKDRFHAWLQVP